MMINVVIKLAPESYRVAKAPAQWLLQPHSWPREAPLRRNLPVVAAGPHEWPLDALWSGRWRLWPGKPCPQPSIGDVLADKPETRRSSRRASDSQLQ